MIVLPEGMNKLDAEDVKSSMSEVERYVDYMREQLDFAATKLERRIKALENAAQQAAQQEGEDQDG